MAVPYKPERYNTVNPMLAVKDARAEVEYLQKAFDAELIYAMEGEDGVYHHAEVSLFGTLVMIGQPGDPSAVHPSTLYMYVEDTDAAWKKAVDAGGTSIKEPETAFYGDRNAAVQSANGNYYWLATNLEALSDEEIDQRAREASQD